MSSRHSQSRRSHGGHSSSSRGSRRTQVSHGLIFVALPSPTPLVSSPEKQYSLHYCLHPLSIRHLPTDIYQPEHLPTNRVPEHPPRKHPHRTLPHRTCRRHLLRGRPTRLPGPHDPGLDLLRDIQQPPQRAPRPHAELPPQQRHVRRRQIPREQRPRKQPQLELRLASSSQNTRRVSPVPFPAHNLFYQLPLQRCMS